MDVTNCIVFLSLLLFGTVDAEGFTNRTCGIPSRSKVPSTIDGSDPVLLGEFPWHAAVYDKTKNNTLICGANIVSPYALLSAAHCFHDRTNARFRDAKDYEIAVSKISNNRFTIDSPTTQFYQIESLISNKFKGIQTHYQQNIIIVVTKNKISFNPQVSPVCLFPNSNAEIPSGALLDVPATGSIDKLGNPTTSPFLKVAHLPYYSFDDCFKLVTDQFLHEFLSAEKFCVTQLNGTFLHLGDSGNGLVFKSAVSSPYHLVGIVSNKFVGSNVVLNTNVLEYLPWINTQLDKIHGMKNNISRS